MFAALRRKLARFNLHRRVAGAAQALRFEVASALRREQTALRLPGYPAPLLIRRASSDLLVFHQMFAERELEGYLPPRQARLIIDGGANVGFSTAFYANRYPDAKVVAVEPQEENFRQLCANCRPFPNVIRVAGGIWPRKASLRPVLGEAGFWGCQVEEVEGGGGVPAFPVDELIALAGGGRVDLLKLDIEGAERAVFAEGTERWLPLVDALLIELHGPEAEAAVRSAVGGSDFREAACGEKVLFVRTSVAGDRI